MPMLGHVLLFCSLIFFLFGIIAVILWKGTLRYRCVIEDLDILNATEDLELDKYYQDPMSSREFICSSSGNGLHQCDNLWPSFVEDAMCNRSYYEWENQSVVDFSGCCINWNQYYNSCVETKHNPFQGALHFDNIFASWITIFVAISLEGWTDIMYSVQDAQSFWVWVYFVFLIVVGALFMVQLFLVVIASQYAETRNHETEMIEAENAKHRTEKDLETTETTIYSTVLLVVMKVNIFSLGHKQEASQKDCTEKGDDGSIEATETMNQQIESSTTTTKNNICGIARNVVESSWFSRVVIVAILLNTLALAVEHYNQPDSITVILEYANYFFTALFAVEMILKLVGLGCYEYCSDSFNLFDAAIVIISVIDAFQEGESGGMSVFRAFRLLRIFRLVRFLPTLQHQISVMTDTLEEMTVFLGIVGLCIFIFAFNQGAKFNIQHMYIEVECGIYEEEYMGDPRIMDKEEEELEIIRQSEAFEQTL